MFNNRYKPMLTKIKKKKQEQVITTSKNKRALVYNDTEVSL